MKWKEYWSDWRQIPCGWLTALIDSPSSRRCANCLLWSALINPVQFVLQMSETKVSRFTSDWWTSKANFFILLRRQYCFVWLPWSWPSLCRSPLVAFWTSHSLTQSEIENIVGLVTPLETSWLFLVLEFLNFESMTPLSGREWNSFCLDWWISSHWEEMSFETSERLAKLTRRLKVNSLLCEFTQCIFFSSPGSLKSTREETHSHPEFCALVLISSHSHSLISSAFFLSVERTRELALDREWLPHDPYSLFSSLFNSSQFKFTCHIFQLYHLSLLWPWQGGGTVCMTLSCLR